MFETLYVFKVLVSFSTAEFVPEKNVVIIGTSFIGMNALCFLVYINFVFTLFPGIKTTWPDSSHPELAISASQLTRDIV